MAKQGVKDIEKHLIVKPFVGNTQAAAEEKYRSRKKVIGQCGTAIFVFGEMSENSSATKSGVMEEFEIACEQHKTIIPIAYPGMVSEIIWEKVKGELTRYPYLEGRIDLLTSVQSPEFLSQIIIHILDSVQESM